MLDNAAKIIYTSISTALYQDKFISMCSSIGAKGCFSTSSLCLLPQSQRKDRGTPFFFSHQIMPDKEKGFCFPLGAFLFSLSVACFSFSLFLWKVQISYQ